MGARLGKKGGCTIQRIEVSHTKQMLYNVHS